MHLIYSVKLSDIEEIALLEEQNFNEYERYSLNQLKEIISDEKYVFLKLYETQQIISYIILLKVENEYEILKICTHSNFRGKGYANILLKLVINQFKINNTIKIFLEVRESNIRAINLYKKNNFKIIGKRINYYGNEDAILMEYS